MALLLLEGWDRYGADATQCGRVWNPAVNFTSTAGHVKTNTYALGGNGSGAWYGRNLVITAGTAYFGMWIYCDSGWRPAQGGCILGFISGVPYNGFNGVCSLSLNTDGTLRVTRDFNSGTTLGTSTATINYGVLNYIECKFVFGASGSYIVRLNGTEVLNASGDMGGTTINGINLCNAGVDHYALDGLWILDSTGSAPYNTFLGEQIVTDFLPNTGNGANTGLTPSTGTDHGALVDEAVANDDTDYNGGGASVKDTYNFTTSSLAGFTINGVQLSMCVKATSAGTNTVNGVTRIGGTDYDGSSQAITTSYAYYTQLWGPRPSDSAAWIQSDLAEFGMKSVAAAGANRLTQIFLEVLSSSAAVPTKFRRTLSQFGTRTGTRQLHNYS